MFSKKKVTAIIPAGGIGQRMNLDLPKQFIEISGKPIIVYTLEAISECRYIDEIVVAVPDGYISYLNKKIKEYGLNKVTKILCGGKTRQQTVYKCISEDVKNDYILIHDAVRPFIDTKILSIAIDEAYKHGASAVGKKAVDTLKLADESGFISKTVDRSKIWQIETPQIFKKDILIKAHETATEKNYEATDDCQLVEFIGEKIKLIENDTLNLKITHTEDLKIMEAFFNEF